MLHVRAASARRWYAPCFCKRAVFDCLRILSSLSPAQCEHIAASVTAAFPDLRVRCGALSPGERTSAVPRGTVVTHEPGRVAICARAWLDSRTDPRVLDAPAERAAREGAFELVVLGAGLSATSQRIAALQIATRCQRLLGLQSALSRAPELASILAAHRGMHDLDKPLVAADYSHALDTHRWVLRLCPTASPSLQVAALFHDVERLVSESDVRIEHHAPDYAAFKHAHARAGAQLAVRTLLGAGAPERLAARVAQLVAAHERPGDDPELVLLNEADGLSFFSLNASGFVDYYGLAHTRRKVRYTLARLGRRGLGALTTVRHHPAIADMLARGIDDDGPQTSGGAAA